MERIAVDIGGTFTDIVYLDDDDGEIITNKVRSTPSEVGRAVFEAIEKIGVDMSEIDLFVHGTTVGLNAVVQRKGAKVGLITTKGFTDVLEMARGNREELYGYLWKKPKPLVPRELRLGVDERMDHLGQIVRPVQREDVAKVLDVLRAQGVEAVAVCLLHSYANPAHELEIGAMISDLWPDEDVSLSHQVAREFREYERMSTTVLDAYIKRIVVRYLTRVDDRLKEIGFKGQFLIVSPSGILGVNAIKEKSIATFASGPIGGVSGAARITRTIQVPEVVIMDVGGTSFDVSLIKDGTPLVRHQTELMGYPLLLPGMDIRPIGAGGGSLARVDAGGMLTVGPDSAGADPGPMCYGLGGGEPTVTDAALVNGFIDPDYFLGGEIQLNKDLAMEGVGRIAKKLGMGVHEAAEGILTVARNNMTTATKEILIGQGFDPRDFSLMSYGGAGGIFAAGIVRDMSMPRIIIPPNPGVFSARGMLTMDIIHAFSQTHSRSMTELDIAELTAIYEDMAERGRAMLEDEQIPAKAMSFIRTMDMCYEGQGHYVEVEIPGGKLEEAQKKQIVADFHTLHIAKFGHRMDAPAKTINIRLKAVGKIKQAEEYENELTYNVPPDAFKMGRQVFFRGEHTEWAVLDRGMLAPGNTFNGPLLVEERQHNLIVLPGQTLTVDAYTNLIIDNSGNNTADNPREA